jgi:hypothetical protein
MIAIHSTGIQRLMFFLQFTGQLLDFLKTNNEIATHFVIGYSIQQNVSAWQLLLSSGHDLAAHTSVFPHRFQVKS